MLKVKSFNSTLSISSKFAKTNKFAQSPYVGETEISALPVIDLSFVFTTRSCEPRGSQAQMFQDRSCETACSD